MSSNLNGLPGKIVRIGLPEPFRFWFYYRFRRGKPQETLDWMSDQRLIRPQKDVELWVYWYDMPSKVRGPAASLYVLGEEVLRLNCFQGNKAHMHLNPRQQEFAMRVAARLFFPDGSPAERVERAAFELRANTDAALKSNRIGRVRDFRIDSQALMAASNAMRAYMMELLDRHPA